MIVLDTHVAIWVIIEDRALGKKARALISDALADGQLGVSAITFWEIALLIAKRRLRALDDPYEGHAMMLRAGIRELPITGGIAILAVALENLHSDPADRIIAATAIAHSATLITADDALLHWRSTLKRHDGEK